ncbi:MAG: hypothetical protein NDJ18_00905 [candidate division Zixibacteria bacterium]|nr:hypothetical protein [candidate division Zixibacteria bacterium]
MRKITLLLTISVLLAVVVSCTSRYRIELFQTADEVRRKVKVESTQYIPGRVLGDPNAIEKFAAGNGNTMIVTTGTRGVTQGAETYAVLRFDEYFRCDIYFELPEPVLVDSLPLMDNSYLWIKGRYDQPAGSRLFMPESGYLAIDSIASGRLYATLNGVFRNADATPLAFDGQFRVKFKD